ncbi:MAG: sulfotransferase domain-containing protein [Nitrosomonadales bacterium]|nr:sulfotransferase domain-containing protein [Nitrosomonadales bacterium]
MIERVQVKDRGHVISQAASDKKVGFLVGGTQKGGTSALDLYLRMHPRITMGNDKEIHFFDDEKRFMYGPPDYQSYLRNFSPTSSFSIIGEATPIYMYWYAVPKRVWEYNPAMKWILVLRNPIERAYSHWNMERRRGAESLPFLDALHRERERCREALPEQHRVYSYTDRGFYSEQIRRLWHFFPAEQTLILKSEDLQGSPERTLNRVCTFLGVGEMPKAAYEMAHVGEYNSAMSDAERAYLKGVFAVEIMALEKLLGWDCSSWTA